MTHEDLREIARKCARQEAGPAVARVRAVVQAHVASGHGAGKGAGVIQRVRGRTLTRWAGYTGILAAFVVAVAGIKYLNPRQAPSTEPERTYATAPGQRANVTLADGSKVIIAPATTVRVSGRIITLSGEATFIVNSDNATPFVVKTANAETRVLGTTFFVRLYDNEVRTQVVVAEGKVVAQSLILTAGEGAYVSQTSKARLPDAEVMRALARTSGRLVFESALAPAVFAELGRWYDVRFEGTERIDPATKITMTFSEPSLSRENLSILSAILGREVKVLGNVVHINEQ